MNDTKKLDVETCIDRLQEIVLDVLAKAKENKKCLGASDIATETGIREQFDSDASQPWIPSFTRALLLDLQQKGSVKQYGKGHGSYWEISD